MSNLSDLLPTGGGQNAVDFVASGTLGSGVTVVLNNDGTVSVVGITGPLATENIVAVTSYTPYNAELNSTGDKILVIYRDASQYGVVVAGDISGTSITFGTPVVFYSRSLGWNTLTFDPIQNRFLVVFDGQDNISNPFLFGRVISITGTSIGLGAQTSLQTFRSAYHKGVYDPASQKHIVFFKHIDEGSATYIKYYAGALTVSGSTVSMGALTEVDGDSFDYFPVYDSAAGKVAIFYRPTTNSYLTAKVCTVSGTSLSFGSSTVIAEIYTRDSVAYDPSTNRIVVVYYNNTSLRVVVGYISSNAVVLGTPSTIYTGPIDGTVCAYNSSKQNIFIAYRGSSSPNDAFIIEADVSGESVILGTSSVFNTNNNFLIFAGYSGSTENAIVFYRKTDNSAAVDILKASSNYASFIGITAEAIADTATGLVNVFGGINEAQSGLTIAADYYVQADGSIATTVSDVKIGQAISATTINIRDLT